MLKKLLRIYCFILLTPLSQNTFASINIEESSAKTIYRVSVEGLDWQDAKLGDMSFSRISLKGVNGYEGIIAEIGRPEIPVIRFYVQGQTKVQLVEEPSITVRESENPLLPVQSPRVKIENALSDFSFDADLYHSLDEFPGDKAYEITPSGSVRGVPQYMVTLYPVTYIPKTNTFKFRKFFQFEVLKSLIVPKDPKTLIFIVGPQFAKSPSLQSFEKHKERLGFKTLRLNVAQGERPESIRSRLKKIYKSTPFSFGLIIGDQEDVPAKQSTRISGVTDHFYRAIDTEDYLSDINGPDIGLGRFAAANESQLASMVGKSMRYDAAKAENASWLKEASWLATDDRWQIAEGTHNYVIESYTGPQGYWGAFPQKSQPGGDQLYAVTHRVTDATVLDAIAKGRAIINYSGHGSHISWAAPSVTQMDVKNLTGTKALPFVISNACITGDFRVGESFAETWQRHPLGAIAFWGSMDNSYWDEDDILERRMYDGIFKHHKSKFGEITDWALGELWRHYGGKGLSAYYRETYVLFGDPSQQFLTPMSLPPPTPFRTFILESDK